MLSLDEKRAVDHGVVDKVVKTICAIANNGPNRIGRIIIGVTDKDSDAERVKKLDGVEPKRVGKRYVVGVAREAKCLGISMGDYVAKWKDAIRNSELSIPVRDSVLSSLDFNSLLRLGRDRANRAPADGVVIRRP